MAENRKPTLIAILLDGSGSMLKRREDAMGSINSLVQDQKRTEGDAVLMINIFSSGTKAIIELLKPQLLHATDDEVVTIANYVPDGMTALLDSIVSTIVSVEKFIAQHGEYEVFILILTDGKENDSTEFKSKKAEVGELMAERQKQGWKIRFMSADWDAVEEARDLRIDHVHHVKGAHGYGDSMSGHSQEISLSRTGSGFGGSDSGSDPVH